VKLGHMECLVTPPSEAQEESVTFLYTLGEGGSPKSFGINVAKLAGLPEEVLSNAKRISSEFEEEMNGVAKEQKLTARTARDQRDAIQSAINSGNWDEVSRLWQALQI
jgi:DNA mismatch repair protein MSH6